MADYTTTANMPRQGAGTRLIPRAGIVERYASNGAVRLRATQTTTKLDIQIVHNAMTQAERNALVAFYTANRTTSFTFACDEDGVTRTCVFAAKPYDITPLGGSKYRATVYLLEA